MDTIILKPYGRISTKMFVKIKTICKFCCCEEFIQCPPISKHNVYFFLFNYK